ncbi:MAG: hypothetical protein AAF514_13710 [Verrucomicrobiota bacterium]
MILSLVGFYAVIGLIFGLAFVLLGVKRIDPAAEGGTWGFKLLILPGCLVFWPLLLIRWVRKSPPPEEGSIHRRAARKH